MRDASSLRLFPRACATPPSRACRRRADNSTAAFDAPAASSHYAGGTSSSLRRHRAFSDVPNDYLVPAILGSASVLDLLRDRTVAAIEQQLDGSDPRCVTVAGFGNPAQNLDPSL